MSSGIESIMATNSGFKGVLDIIDSMSSNDNALLFRAIKNTYDSFLKVINILGHYKVGYTSEILEHVSWIYLKLTY